MLTGARNQQESSLDSLHLIIGPTSHFSVTTNKVWLSVSFHLGVQTE